MTTQVNLMSSGETASDRRLLALLELSRTLGRATRFREVAAAVLAALSDLFEDPCTAVLAYDVSTGFSRVVAATPASGEVAQAALTDEDHRAVDRLAGATVWAPDRDRDSVLARLADGGTLLLVPVRDGSELFGCLVHRVAASDHAVPGGAELVLEAVAAQAAVTARSVALRARVSVAGQRDSLTGLGNRSYLLQVANAAIAAPGARVAVLFVDLDGFKAVNDRLGHAAGDQLLQVTARRIKGVLRNGEHACRLGGDEFAVVLAGADAEVAAAVANRIVAAVSEPVDVGGASTAVGASIGVASFPAHGRTIAEVLAAADEAMYRAKRAGKGRVEVSGERHMP